MLLKRSCRILGSFWGSSTSCFSSLSPHSTTSTYSNENQTHFGFRNLGEEEKKEAVLGVFHSVADSYDLMNDAMSLGIHRVWKDTFVRRLGPGPTTRLLDVAGGTGDIAFRFLEAAGRPADAGVQDPATEAAVTVCDINKSMLRVGEARAQKLGDYNLFSA
jgi:2-methoxy-6-polyprenyl-1,4-benzoquinol methylase